MRAVRRNLALISTFGVYACNQGAAPSDQSAPPGWQTDWAIQPGFSLTMDTQGYEFPTAIAFVPQPGDQPKDPLYFVTELRGKVKVVTNDRTVYTFAQNFFSLNPPEELPAQAGEIGLAGICLAPAEGYVFVTFAYQDRDKILRNNIIRFQSTPRKFSTRPVSQRAFTDVFSEHISAPSHQIGPCQVRGSSLLVGVGDGEQPYQSQNLESVLGKILRMTLDGRPAPGNPVRQDDRTTNATNYVWAFGLRNPFSLKGIGDRLFVVDNGPDADRFVEIKPGANYLWNGTDWSAGTHAFSVLAPAVGAVQMDYHPAGLGLFPLKYQQTFFVAASGDLRNTQAKRPGVVTLRYGLGASELLSVPEVFLSYRGTAHQMVTGLAFGPDGLYIVPLFPTFEGRTAVLRVRYDPAHEHSVVIGRGDPALPLMQQKGCFGCHTLPEVAEGGSAGPRLDRDSLVHRLLKRLHSPAYRKTVEEVDQLTAQPFSGYREARRAVLAAQGLDRVRVWLTNRIREPRFDSPFSQMPNLGLSEREASTIADFLLSTEEDENTAPPVQLWQRLPPPRHRYTLLAFIVGAMCFPLIKLLLRRYRSSK